MTIQCYIVEIKAENKKMFNTLNKSGFKYKHKKFMHDYMEIYIRCCPCELHNLEEIMKWYV